MTAPEAHRPWVATGLVVVIVSAMGLAVGLPAWQAYSARVQGQDLAGKVLLLCGQGGEEAAPLVQIGACPLAQQVRSTPTTVAESSTAGITPDQLNNLIRQEVARQLPKTVPPPTPAAVAPPLVTGGSAPVPIVPPGAAGLPGREIPPPGPADDERARSTEEAQPPRLPRQYMYPARQREDRTVTERPTPPVTVTERPPVTQTVTEPAPPPVQTVDQPQGTPLLNGVGGLLNGIGAGL